MVIKDHINFSGLNPLIGEKSEARFLNLTSAYDKLMVKKILKAGKENNIAIKKGVYAWFSGPSFETPAEIQALRILGADAVGMSTVPEAILANFYGLRVAAISVITNMAAGLSKERISHKQTKDIANLSRKKLGKLFQTNKFKLTSKYEDCHSAIEDFLTKELGSVGKKIHTGRSRNDQVMVAMRLYTRKKLDEIQLINLKVAKAFLKKSEKHSSDPMPGYTHLQRAMPSSWGLWFAAFAESFLDNADLLSNTKSWLNVNPLGTAAGYGVNLPIKRDISTKELNFKRKQLNSLYVQNSRGKFELELIGALKQPMLDIRKFSWDVSLFLSQEFNLLSLPPIYSTGSSIMPNKSNPDVIEIMRANYSMLAGHYSELENLISLPSGYHRDLQLTKRSLIHSVHCVLKTMNLLPDLVLSLIHI